MVFLKFLTDKMFALFWHKIFNIYLYIKDIHEAMSS